MGLSDSIRALQVKATADTTDLQTGMQDARQSVEGVGSSSKGAQRDVTRSSGRMGAAMKKVAARASMAAAAAAAAGAAYAAHLVRQGLQAADEQAKLARQLGFTNEQLAILQRAGELSGMSARQLTGNIERLNRRLGEASEDSGQAADALERLGLSFSDIDQLEPQEQMEVLGRALQGVESQTRKASIASDLFGRSGQEMLVLLENVEGTVDRATDEVERFGLALSEEQSSEIETINDDFSTLQASVRGAGMQLASAFSPALQEAASIVVELSGNIGRWARSLAEARQQTEDLTEAQRVLEGIQAGEARTIEEVQEARNAVVEERRNNAQEIENLTEQAIQKEREAQDAQGETAAIAQSRAMAMRGSIRDIRAEQDELAIDLRELNDEYMEMWDNARDGAGRTADETETSFGQYEEAARAAVNAGFREAEARAEMFEQMNRDYDLTEEKLAVIEDEIEGLIEASEEHGISASEAIQMQGGALAELIELYGELNQREEDTSGLESRLEAVQTSLMSESELRRQQYQTDLDALRQAREAELVTEEEFAEIRNQLAERNTEAMRQEFLAREDANRESEEQMTEDTRRESQRRLQFASRVGGQMANNLISTFKDIATASTDNEKKQWEARQNAARASAVVSTAQGIMKAWATHADNPPLAAAISATVAAAGAAQIASINSQSFEGGGSGSGAGTSPGSTNEDQGQQGSGPGDQRTLLVQGDLSRDELFSGDAVRELVDRIGEAQRDGYRVVT